MDREPTVSIALLRERNLAPIPEAERKQGDRLGRELLKAGAAEPCLLGLPGPRPEVPYLGATPDGTAESSIVAGDD